MKGLPTVINSWCFSIPSVQSFSCVQLFATPWTAACQTSLSSVQFSPQSCPTLCDPMNSNTPGFPVHHQFPEFTKTHVHRVGDAIQPSHHLSSPSPPAPKSSQHQGFSNESKLHMRWSKYWSFSFSISPSNEHPGLICFIFLN